jgi:hypothetical protein
VTSPSRSVFDLSREDLDALLRRARAGDPSTLDQVRELLALSPETIELAGGNLAAEAEAAVVASIAGEDLLQAEAIRQRLAEMRQELEDGRGGLLDRLLVQRLVLAWAVAQDAEVRAARLPEPSCPVSVRAADYHRRRLDSATRRLTQAARALSLIRSKLRPAGQPNRKAGRPGNVPSNA